jgi:translation initiation factor IF-2
MANIFRRRKTIKRPAKTVKPTPPPTKTTEVESQQAKTPDVKKVAKSVVLRRKKEHLEEQVPLEETTVAEVAPTEETEQPVEAVAKPESVDSADAVDTVQPEPAVQAAAEKPEAKVQEVTVAAKTETKAKAKEVTKPRRMVGGRDFSKLGKAVIAPPPEYDPNKKPTKPAAAKTTPNANAKPNVNWNDNSQPKNERTDKAGKPAKKQRRRPKERERVHRQRIEMRMDDLPSSSNRRRRSKGRSNQKKHSPKAKAIKRRVFMDTNITVGNLAHGMSVKATELIKKLLQNEQIVTINDTIDFDTAQILASDFEYEVINTAFKEDEFLITEDKTQKGDSESRPAVVTIMGHVDHGKTTLLDKIRKSNVADGEAGGITQHLSAYQVKKNDQLVTFIDTPGHEAFTAMRSRGAQVTDIVVLVVAADDGIMPQTLEAISHAKAAGVQIVVAVNKCDRPNANPLNVRQQLMQHELVPEEYGGDTIFVDLSALHGKGVDDLIDNLVLLSEMGEYSAVMTRHAEGTVLEARLEKGRGPVATVIVQHGTLKVGDSLVIGDVWGRVRAINDYRGKKLKVAGPSTPVEIIGLQNVPTAGETFTVVKSDKDARRLAEHRKDEKRSKLLNRPKKLTLEDLLSMQNEEEKVSLNLIIKSDVGGTLEAIRGSLDKIDVPGTEVKILHDGVGAITEGDISLAHTYNGIVLGFNVRPDAKARKLEHQLNVEVRTYKVIYEALEEIEKALKGLLAPETKEEVKGLAEIRKTFNVPKVGRVAGCYVLEGTISRNHKVRLLRESVVIWEGKLASLYRFKDAVREVEKGYECGMNLEGFNDIKDGDQIETYMIEEIETT